MGDCHGGAPRRDGEVGEAQCEQGDGKGREPGTAITPRPAEGARRGRLGGEARKAGARTAVRPGRGRSSSLTEAGPRARCPVGAGLWTLGNSRCAVPARAQEGNPQARGGTGQREMDVGKLSSLRPTRPGGAGGLAA